LAGLFQLFQPAGLRSPGVGVRSGGIDADVDVLCVRKDGKQNCGKQQTGEHDS